MAVDREKLRAELARMRALIESDPEVKARFDTDGNGVIDGHEWDQVRELVVQRLEREARESAEAAPAEAGASGAGAPAVADQIFEQELHAAPADTGAGRELAARDDLVLEEQGLSALVDSSFVRRRYAIRDPGGAELGQIQQLENEGMQSLASRSVLELPDLHFGVVDGTTGQTLSFRRETGQLVVFDETGAQQGFVTWKHGLLAKTFRIVSSLDRGVLQVKAVPWRPFTLQVIGDLGDEIGTIERAWSGLGAFLGSANRMRIRVEPGRVTLAQRWGLIAAALLAGIDDERD